MSKSNLEQRLRTYLGNLEQVPDLSDPEDSQFFKGYDQAVENISWALRRILENTTEEKTRYLVTEGDYYHAPTGTIVVEDDCHGAFEKIYSWFYMGDEMSRSAADVAGVKRRVLRWGFDD